MSDREKLVKELQKVSDNNVVESETACGCIHQDLFHDYADFILAREQRLRDEHLKVLEAIKEPLNRIGNRVGAVNKEENPRTGNAFYWDDVKEALSIIAAEIGKMKDK